MIMRSSCSRNLAIAALAASLVLYCGRQAWASHAAVTISSIFFDSGPTHTVFDSGTLSAVETLADAYDGATAYGTAQVEGIVDTGAFSVYPKLRVYATGTHSDNGTIVVDGGATASASWSDNLGYGSTAIVDPGFLSLNPYLYFVTRVSGSIDNKATGNFTLTVVSNDGTETFQDTVDLQGPNGFSGPVVLRLPANALLPYGGPDRPAEFALNMTIYGGVDVDGNPGVSDFTHTVEFQSIYIADANGNPIPGSENIVVVGDNGPYPMSAVPEPETWMLLVGGLPILLARYVGRATSRIPNRKTWSIDCPLRG
jgi:hypothetical protein